MHGADGQPAQQQPQQAADDQHAAPALLDLAEFPDQRLHGRDRLLDRLHAARHGLHVEAHLLLPVVEPGAGIARALALLLDGPGERFDEAGEPAHLPLEAALGHCFGSQVLVSGLYRRLAGGFLRRGSPDS